MIKTLAVIQSRLGSTRFPHKALADIHGLPMIAHVIRRARQIRGVDAVILAVPRCDLDAFVAVTLQTPCIIYAPYVPEHDVLARFVKVIDRYPQVDTIVRLTGDTPMLDPEIASQVIELFHGDPLIEYASNVFEADGSAVAGAVDGEDVEVFSRQVLLRSHRHATELFDKEHVTAFMRRHAKTATLRPTNPRYGLKTSVDTEADLLRVRMLL